MLEGSQPYGAAILEQALITYGVGVKTFEMLGISIRAVSGKVCAQRVTQTPIRLHGLSQFLRIQARLQ